MMVRIFTLRFNRALEGFDDTPLTEFISDKTVISLREYFFISDQTPYLTVIVKFEPVADMKPVQQKTSNRQKNESWRKLLSDKDMPLFETLRSWRAEQAKKDGVPPYVICNNKQLATIVASKAKTISALQKIEGFGRVKIAKYGQQILSVCNKEQQDEQHGGKND